MGWEPGAILAPNTFNSIVWIPENLAGYDLFVDFNGSLSIPLYGFKVKVVVYEASEDPFNSIVWIPCGRLRSIFSLFKSFNSIVWIRARGETSSRNCCQEGYFQFHCMDSPRCERLWWREHEDDALSIPLNGFMCWFTDVWNLVVV